MVPFSLQHRTIKLHSWPTKKSKNHRSTELYWSTKTVSSCRHQLQELQTNAIKSLKTKYGHRKYVRLWILSRKNKLGVCRQLPWVVESQVTKLRLDRKIHRQLWEWSILCRPPIMNNKEKALETFCAICSIQSREKDCSEMRDAKWWATYLKVGIIMIRRLMNGAISSHRWPKKKYWMLKSSQLISQ